MAWKRFVFVADNHGDMIDRKANDLFFTFVEEWKPHYRFHGGDCWDIRSLRVGASKEEKEESVIADFDEGFSFLKEYRPNVFCRGNHDERLWHEAAKARGVIRDLCLEKTRVIESWARSKNVRMKPYDKAKGIHKVGRLKIGHGYFSGKEACKYMAQAYGSILFGHTHRIDTVSLPAAGHKGRRVVARSTGCLCRLDMDYNSRQPFSLAQAHGWAYGVIDDVRGSYQVFQAEVIGNQVVVADSIRIISAR